MINLLTDLFTDTLVKISLRHRHAQMVKNGVSSSKTKYIDIFFFILKGI